MQNKIRIVKIFIYKGQDQVETPEAYAGDIVAVAGIKEFTIGETITSIDNPIPLKPIAIDQPTISMDFVSNTSPFAGKEGDYVTSSHIKKRLQLEAQKDIAIKLDDLENGFVLVLVGDDGHIAAVRFRQQERLETPDGIKIIQVPLRSPLRYLYTPATQARLAKKRLTFRDVFLSSLDCRGSNVISIAGRGGRVRRIGHSTAA